MRTFRVSTGLTVKRDESRDQNWVKLLVELKLILGPFRKKRQRALRRTLLCEKDRMKGPRIGFDFFFSKLYVLTSTAVC